LNLNELGWSEHFAAAQAAVAAPNLVPARVARQDYGCYLVFAEKGELVADVRGRLRHEAQGPADLPAVGDWVAVQPWPGEAKATICAVLPRRSCISRKTAGARTDEQVLAANVDTLFLMVGLDRDFNPRRVERYLTFAWESGASPVILLNKADLCKDVEDRVLAIETIACGVPVHALSALAGDNVEAIRGYFVEGRTAAFLGSSGVGKSTLINALIGEERQEVGAVRESDGRGRHTTTRRELVFVPAGGMIVDTPGMRELQLWADEDAAGRTFGDIETLARRCRFRDCTHRTEPGCAVQAALDDGELDAGRLESYRKQQRELAYLARRQNESARRIEQAKWKSIHKQIKELDKTDKRQFGMQ